MYCLWFEPHVSTTLHTVAGAPPRSQRSADTQSGVKSVNTSSFPYIEVLRGRDGRDGRDGVPGAMLQQGWKSQWSQLKRGVHQHGLWSILATSCQKEDGVTASVPRMSVLTRTQTQYQAVLLILTVLCFTMLKPTAMECSVHLTMRRKNSPVQFVPNREY